MSLSFQARDSAAQTSRRQDSLKLSTAARELASAFPEIEAVAYAPRLDLLSPDSMPSRPAFFVRFAPETRPAFRRDILERSQALLRQRLGVDSLSILEQ
jgi:hypothetical protein